MADLFDIVVARKLSGGGGGGGSSDFSTALTEESVTVEVIPGTDYAGIDLEYSQIINTAFIRVTLNGTTYVCQRSVDEYGGNVYGATESEGTYDWSEFPFQIWSGDDDGICTAFTVPTAGTYNIKIEVPQSGGGSSDFSTANVTLNNSTEQPFNAPIIITTSMGAPFDFINPVGENAPSGDYTIVLYKGNALAVIPVGNIETGGAIEDLGSSRYCITGDCTITIS